MIDGLLTLSNLSVWLMTAGVALFYGFKLPPGTRVTPLAKWLCLAVAVLTIPIAAWNLSHFDPSRYPSELEEPVLRGLEAGGLSLWLGILLSCALRGLFYLLCMRAWTRLGERPITWGENPEESARSVALSGAVSALGLAAMVWLLSLFVPELASSRSTGPNAILEFLAVWLAFAGFTAIGEELVFRGFLPAWFERLGASAQISLFVSLGLWLMVHYPSDAPEPWVRLPLLCAIGLTFSVLRRRSGIGAAIVAHGTYNAAIGLLRFL